MDETLTYEKKREIELNARDFKGPITSPDHPLHHTVQNITQHLRLSDNFVLRANRELPLEISERIPMGSGFFQVVQRERKTVGHVGFEPGILTSNHTPDIETRVEETIHWLHDAANPFTRNESLQISRNRETWYRMKSEGVNESAAIIDKVRDAQLIQLRIFSEKIGITPRTKPVSESDFEHAIGYLIEKNQSGKHIVRMSMGQVARLHSAFDAMQLSVDSKTTSLVSSCCASFEYCQNQIAITEGEHFSEKMRMDSDHELLIYKLDKRIVGASEDGVQWTQIAKAFEIAGVNLDDPDYLQRQLENKIRSLNPDQLRKSISNYILRKPLSPTEIGILSKLFADTQQHGNLTALRQELVNAEGERLEDIRDRTQSVIVRAIDEITPQTIEEDGASILIKLLNNHQRSVIKEQYVNSTSVFFFDDLPGDAIARDNLLRNPQYLLYARKAALKAINEGNENHPFQPAKVASGITTSTSVRNSFLGKSFGNLASAAYVSDTTRKIERDNFYSGYRQLSVTANAHYDSVLTNKHNGHKHALHEIPTQDAFSSSRRIAQGQSNELMRLAQVIQSHAHRRDVLKEPIAKVIRKQMVQGKPEDIEFPSAMMGEYSATLRTEGGREWVDKLWRFVDKLRSKKNGEDVLLKFFAAVDLSQQQTIVNGYLA
ncbi:hypothetical protein IPM62_00825 [Candidatus Woesebacteria bacterium]|nr:MAG: hypothetical protein IPM62_00825 [Candidatus Woesebacteria bacterium]